MSRLISNSNFSLNINFKVNLISGMLLNFKQILSLFGELIKARQTILLV
ncbi:unnamed protein product, partial [marine sediment metagenome]